MTKIGVLFGISRQQVHQILKRNNLNRHNGGKHVTVVKNREYFENYIIAKKSDDVFRNYKCTIEEYEDIKNEVTQESYINNPTRRYRLHVLNSKRRGIEFKLSLPQWWEIWKNSGHWKDRGQGKYVMARNGDIGPYDIGNVKIITSSENIKEIKHAY